MRGDSTATQNKWELGTAEHAGITEKKSKLASISIVERIKAIVLLRYQLPKYMASYRNNSDPKIERRVQSMQKGAPFGSPAYPVLENPPSAITWNTGFGSWIGR